MCKVVGSDNSDHVVFNQYGLVPNSDGVSAAHRARPANLRRAIKGIGTSPARRVSFPVSRESNFANGETIVTNEQSAATPAEAKDWNKLPAAKSGNFRLGGDLDIHRLGFGAMRITGAGVWGEPKDRNEAIRVLRRAVDLGINFIDTADSYGPNVSEEIVAEALHPYPLGLVIATKAGFERTGPDKWVTNGKPAHLRAACEGSLRRLRLDRIDLFQLHRIDTAVPPEDQLGTLKDLQSEGKIRHIGLSEVSVEQIEHARTIVPIVSVQNRYSVVDRAAEDVLGYCEKADIGFIPWFPLAAGKVSRAGTELERTAKELKVSPSQLALAWLLHHSPVILPIPGTSKVDHLEENVAAAALTIPKGTLSERAKANRGA
jgi:pyridoxine 4-dehydrogenase